jgi:hypothetical protein
VEVWVGPDLGVNACILYCTYVLLLFMRCSPVCYARHDFGLNILVDVFPRLPFLGSLPGEQRPQIAWPDRRDYISRTEVVKVVDD